MGVAHRAEETCHLSKCYKLKGMLVIEMLVAVATFSLARLASTPASAIPGAAA